MFSMAHGTEVIDHAEIGEKSPRVERYDAERNQQALRASLDLIGELREAASIRAARYRAHMKKAYNNCVKPRTFSSRISSHEVSIYSAPSGKVGSQVGSTIKQDSE